MIDNYSHNDSTIYYVSESIPGPLQSDHEYSKLLNEYNSQITRCCNCIDICSKDCSCLKLSQTSKNNYKQTKDFHNVDDNNINGYILECNDLCTCSENCSNRIVQKGPLNDLEIKMCIDINKGYGLFSKSFISKDTFICEYAGEIITESEARRRHYINSVNNKMNYIYSLNEIIEGKKLQTFIDPSIFGNIGRYINHSCNPNSTVVPVRINCPIPKLAIFSCCDISPGCEITFSYGQNNLMSFEAEKSNIGKLCICQSHQCKGNLPFQPF